jgi:CheY-like chemotaxis protein
LETIDRNPALAAGRGSDLAHAMATPTAKLRLYAGTLADCLPVLIAVYRAQSDAPRLPNEYLTLLPDVPDRLMALADSMDSVARDYGARGDAQPEPAADAAVAQASVPRRASGPASDPVRAPIGAARPRVLLVEDDYDSRELTRVMLHLDGWEVSVAGDGDPALDLLARQPFDLVLMDCRLTAMDGWEATARLRAGGINRKVPVIGLSASPEEADRARGIAAGMDEYLVKPLTEAHLADLRRRYSRQLSDHPRPSHP